MKGKRRFDQFRRRTRRLFAALRAGRRGAVVVYLAVAAIPLVGFLGLAVDTTRGYLVKAQLSQALDAAGLAGGRVIDSANLGSDIQMYFNANFPPGFMDATVTGPSWEVSPDNQKVTLTASAVIPTTFLRVLGEDTMTVSASTQVTRETTMLDLVIAIDMSGSMNSTDAGNGMSRIEAARNAANQLVDILFGSNTTNSLLNIGIVPWNSKVNVTQTSTPYDPTQTTTVPVPTFTNPLTNAAQSQVYYANNSPVPLLNPPPTDWKGCVYSRFINDGFEGTDTDDKLYSYSFGSGDWNAWEPVGPEGEPVPGWAKCSSAVDNRECTPCLSHGITPMSHDKQTVTDAIDALTSPTGNTNLPEGLAWAWRVLMPGNPFDQADPAPTIRRQEAIVLITDGQNVGGSGDGYKAVFGTGSAAQPAMDDRLRAVAAAIKAQGAIIYTIQFANAGTSSQALLKEIASAPNSPYYHYAPDAATLGQAFKEIANNLSQLRLSK